jgi:hypothetical protein
MTKVGIIIPSRGNERPEFIKNCFRQLEPICHLVTIEHVDYNPLNNEVDITQRYKHGYNRLRGEGLDLIFAIENDDWYSHDYFKVMIEAWQNMGKPDLIGVDYTYYYHLKLKKYFKYDHPKQASMMCTAIKADLAIEWPKDNYPFTDMHLWRTMSSKKLFRPHQPIAISMKGHGVGKTGGTGHEDRLQRYVNEDYGFLREHLDDESFKFFSGL